MSYAVIYWSQDEDVLFVSFEEEYDHGEYSLFWFMERWITTGETMEILEWIPTYDKHSEIADDACRRWREHLFNLGYAICRPREDW